MHANGRVAAENDKAIVDYQARAPQYIEAITEAKASRSKRLLEASALLEASPDGAPVLPGRPMKDGGAASQPSA